MNMRRLKAKFVERGLTQKDVAEQVLKKSVQTLNYKLNGKRSFDTEEINALCAYFGIESYAEKCEIFLG